MMKKIRKTKRVKKEKLSEITRDFLNNKMSNRLAFRQREEETDDIKEYEEEDLENETEENKDWYRKTDIRRQVSIYRLVPSICRYL